MTLNSSNCLSPSPWETMQSLFPINRSLTGEGNRKTLDFIAQKLIPELEIRSIKSGTKVFDWTVPPEWNVSEAFVKNANGEKIIDYDKNNLHLVSYSDAFSGIVEVDELKNHIHTLHNHPSWIPYRTTYYSRCWGFCATQEMVESEKFSGPFEVQIKSDFDPEGELLWGECLKKGKLDKEVLISTYCCHPSLANDNLSGLVAAIFLFKFIQTINTKYSYRLVIAPETIGAISFLSSADTQKIIGGMVVSCTGGPDKFSIKEGFDQNHWINKAAHKALQTYTDNDYMIYPFVPDGSDERQYSTPAFKIVTPSIHRSKYYEYEEYHTSADNLDYVSEGSLMESIDVHKIWVNYIETFCTPIRTQMSCEFQLGKRGLYPDLGGTFNSNDHIENFKGPHKRFFNFNDKIHVRDEHLHAFHWLMHLADGNHDNFHIAEKSNIDLSIINEAIGLFLSKKLLELE